AGESVVGDTSSLPHPGLPRQATPLHPTLREDGEGRYVLSSPKLERKSHAPSPLLAWNHRGMISREERGGGSPKGRGWGEVIRHRSIPDESLGLVFTFPPMQFIKM